jgi:hypothetical protein
MVTLRVSGLVFRGDSGQAEGSPVGEAADNTAGADDLGTGIAGDSAG